MIFTVVAPAPDANIGYLTEEVVDVATIVSPVGVCQTGLCPSPLEISTCPNCPGVTFLVILIVTDCEAPPYPCAGAIPILLIPTLVTLVFCVNSNPGSSMISLTRKSEVVTPETKNGCADSNVPVVDDGCVSGGTYNLPDNAISPLVSKV